MNKKSLFIIQILLSIIINNYKKSNGTILQDQWVSKKGLHRRKTLTTNDTTHRQGPQGQGYSCDVNRRRSTRKVASRRSKSGRKLQQVPTLTLVQFYFVSFWEHKIRERVRRLLRRTSSDIGIKGITGTHSYTSITLRV